jgi:hypothetical protein
MPVNATPSATLEVIQAKLFLGFPKTVFDRPASERNAKNFSQRPSIPARHTIGQKIFCLIRQYIAGDNKRTLIADELSARGLSPTDLPADFPNLTSVMRVLDAIPLWTLVTKRRRPDGQILHLAWLVSLTKTRVLLGSATTVSRRFFQYPGLLQPNPRVGWNFDHKCFAKRIQSIQKSAVAPVKFIRSPRHDPNPVAYRVLDLIQCNLRFRLELNVFGYVVFFRRAGSSA